MFSNITKKVPRFSSFVLAPDVPEESHVHL